MTRLGNRLRIAGMLAVALACAACERPATETATNSAPAAQRHDEAAASDGTADHGHGGAGEARPLLAIMQDLGSRMNALTYALMTGDSARVAASAGAIAEHAAIAPADLERVRRVLGPDTTRFNALDLAVHETAQELAGAALAGEPELVIERLGEVQRGCVVCHAEFRERLRTAGAAE